MIHREPPATHRDSRALAAGCVRRSQVCRFKLDSSQIALRGCLYMFRFCGSSSAPDVAHGPRSEAQVWLDGQAQDGAFRHPRSRTQRRRELRQAARNQMMPRQEDAGERLGGPPRSARNSAPLPRPEVSAQVSGWHNSASHGARPREAEIPSDGGTSAQLRRTALVGQLDALRRLEVELRDERRLRLDQLRSFEVELRDVRRLLQDRFDELEYWRARAMAAEAAVLDPERAPFEGRRRHDASSSSLAASLSIHHQWWRRGCDADAPRQPRASRPAAAHEQAEVGHGDGAGAGADGSSLWARLLAEVIEENTQLRSGSGLSR